MNINEKYALAANENELDALLTAHEKVFVLIYATWCPFCMRFLPIFKRHAQSTSAREIKFLLIQDNEERVADKYQVEVVPAVILFEKGKVLYRLDSVPGVGLNEKQLDDFIRSHG